MTQIEKIYSNALIEFIKDKNSSILVIGAQLADREAFYNAGFSNVLLSGYDERVLEYKPYKWTKENGMSISFKDQSFDYVVTHSVLHHMSSPHKGLTEMYRVAKKGVLVFEGRDSFLIQVAEKLNFTQRYEVAGCYSTSGVDGTNIPNYIYRWTEREIEKTINTYAPAFKHKFVYKHWSLYPNGPDLSSLKKIILKVLRPFYFLFINIFPKQQNGFIFFIEKPTIERCLQPWLYLDSNNKKLEVDKNWVKKYYSKFRNKK
ncbi:methyltransferase domain-containing protein [Flavobacterium macrobrachii]|uniref:Methyltransferase domain-containing protein n=1 Tax=Flavobacterium macrobrachii TaxID=591204 RepID=A0ABS2CY39_9FLAO|nr:methyltransferase domain-containing protein [Flavobacterium macrobrachii]MBM6499826.1 methyltransferase domain-containing protein [Flavobacterium macrobrachii]